ncbi:hypothetical protein [Papillibacter cinnamivorans]|uniref:Uncharacterized protein n=1 Tax=Papillibacter cinnamivorans DSM 12816 TaxID=1122930 RepID=A0A1W1YY23_9FIRM|nr:hypothetical protein [Papillibacter cinnamivorans]SMC41034.1 hypothetical protein SAMN02745168_0766 [Papillibacter cinnamivorans DSM 12816]
MATIQADNKEYLCKIDKFFGLNEAADGDTGLKDGEADASRNWKITPEWNLQKRPGYKTVCTVDAGHPIRGSWTGYVAGVKRWVIACNGNIYSIDFSTFAKTLICTMTDAETFFFPFSEKLYMQNGHEYKYWDGTTSGDVSGYVPVTYALCNPSGGGTEIQGVNKLTGSKWQWFSSTADSTVYQLVETDIDSVDTVLVDDVEVTTGFTVNLTDGTVTFSTAPGTGANDVKIKYTKGTGDRSTILAQRFAEMYNGSTDTRIFLYGDGTNLAYYSGIEYETGLPSAEYFPDLNIQDVGDANTPITSMIRLFSKLMAFKSGGSAWMIDYDYLTLEGGTTTAGFYCAAIDKHIGNEPAGQVRLVNNYPFTVQGKAVYRWGLLYSSATQDERAAKLVSRRVAESLKDFDLASVITWDDNYNREYWIIDTSTQTALIYSYANETDAGGSYKNNLWYKYESIPATCFENIDGEVYMGTSDGLIIHFSRTYHGDNGQPIDCLWESGSMYFSDEHMRKFINLHYVTMKPESACRMYLSISTDNKSDFDEKLVSSGGGISTFLNADFAHWSFGTNRRPQVSRIRLKAKKFTHLKLIFSSNSATATATLLAYVLPVAYTGTAK